MSAEAMTAIMAKVLWGVPAAMASFGAMFFIVPRNRMEFASLFCIGLGSGIYIGPWLALVKLPWVERQMTEVMGMFVAGLLGTVVFRAFALAVEKLPLAEIAKGWLSKG